MKTQKEQNAINVFSKTPLLEEDLIKLANFPVEIEEWVQMDAHLDRFGQIKGYHYILRKRQEGTIVRLLNTLNLAA